MAKKEKVFSKKTFDDPEITSDVSEISEAPIVKKDAKLYLGNGVVTFIKGKPIPAGVDKKFFGSLKTEQII